MISLAKCSVRPLIILLVANLAESTFIEPVPMIVNWCQARGFKKADTEL